jgi:hypothetical protein
MTARPIIHTVQNGFCTVCGETEEWLIETAQPIRNLGNDVIP